MKKSDKKVKPETDAAINTTIHFDKNHDIVRKIM